MPLLKLLGIDTQIAKFVEDSMEHLKHNRKVDMKDALFEAVIASFPFQTLLDLIGTSITDEDVRNSPDMVLISNIFSTRLRNITDRCAENFQTVFNPYVLNNKRLKSLCHDDIICIGYKVLEKNRRKIEKESPRLIEDLINEFIVILKDLKHQSKTYCEEYECVFLLDVLKYQNFYLELLTNAKKYKNNILRYILDSIKDSRPMLTDN